MVMYANVSMKTRPKIHTEEVLLKRGGSYMRVSRRGNSNYERR